MANSFNKLPVTIDVDEKHSVDGIVSLPVKRSTWTDFGIIITHGAGGDMNSQQIVELCSKFASAGMTTLRFTCRTPNFGYRVRCYKAVVEFLRLHDDFKVKGCIISGRSMGARVAAELATTEAQKDGFILGLICLSYPLHRPRRYNELRVSHIMHLNLPVLFVSGSKDAMCRRDLLEGIIEQIGADTKMHWVEDADHSLNVKGKYDSDVLGKICQWALEWCQSVIMAER